MKRSYRGVLWLCGVLMLNIIFTQQMIHYFYFEAYLTTVFYMLGNILLFPVAVLIYKKEKHAKVQKRSHKQ
jgi:membrane protein CcdC involved in cytochrome C biogenesis